MDGLLVVTVELPALKSEGERRGEPPGLSGKLIFPTQSGEKRRAALRRGAPSGQAGRSPATNL